MTRAQDFSANFFFLQIPSKTFHPEFGKPWSVVKPWNKFNKFKWIEILHFRHFLDSAFCFIRWQLSDSHFNELTLWRGWRFTKECLSEVNCCGTIGRAVASDTRVPWFVSHHHQKTTIESIRKSVLSHSKVF